MNNAYIKKAEFWVIFMPKRPGYLPRTGFSMGMTHQVRIAASVQESLESLESLAARGFKTIPLPGLLAGYHPS
jgi:hypothetical protein